MHERAVCCLRVEGLEDGTPRAVYSPEADAGLSAALEEGVLWKVSQIEGAANIEGSDFSFRPLSTRPDRSTVTWGA